MTISSRTPEGQPNKCPVCGKALRLEPSQPLSDAPCPYCGSLLWFQPLPSTYTIKPQDRVRIKQGMFTAMVGTVENVHVPDPAMTEQIQQVPMVLGPGTLKHLLATRVVVNLRIFGKIVPVELEADQVELVS